MYNMALHFLMLRGGVAERLNAAVLKTVVRATPVPWVRIPPPPPVRLRRKTLNPKLEIRNGKKLSPGFPQASSLPRTPVSLPKTGAETTLRFDRAGRIEDILQPEHHTKSFEEKLEQQVNSQLISLHSARHSLFRAGQYIAYPFLLFGLIVALAGKTARK